MRKTSTMKTAVSLLHEPSRGKPWIVRWWGEPDPQGRQKRYSKAFRYCQEAKAFRAEKQAALRRGEPRDPVEVSLGQLVDDFCEARLASLSHSSKSGYRNTLDQLLDYFGGAKRVADIGRREAEAFVATRKRCDGRSGDLADWSRARHVIHCRALFAAAVDWRYLSENPFAVKRSGSALSLHPKGKPWQHIKPDQFQRMLALATDPQRRAAYWLMYGCGLRAGEAYNMMVSNVDLANRRVHVVNRAASESIPPFTVKAERQSSASKERSVPIPTVAIADLTEAVRVALKSGGFVVLRAERFQRMQEHWRLCRAGKPWLNTSLWRPWQNRDMMNNLLRDTKRLLASAGVELTAPFNLHTFRKSFAQNHADAGTPPRTLAHLLGHANTRVTMQFYNRVTDANERAAAELMDQLLDHSAQVVHAG